MYPGIVKWFCDAIYELIWSVTRFAKKCANLPKNFKKCFAKNMFEVRRWCAGSTELCEIRPKTPLLTPTPIVFCSKMHFLKIGQSL